MNEKSCGVTLVGVDGCHGGWLAAISKPGGELTANVYRTFAELVDDFDNVTQIGVDIPIGLPASGARQCELMARQLLGRPRSSSVFPVPPRACPSASTYEDACQIRQRIDGKRMSKQAFGILPKIREVDRYLECNPTVRNRVIEVHPELCFWAWNDCKAMVYRKKTPHGQAERGALVEIQWPGDVGRMRERLRGQDYALEDLYDALAALWSVRRWVDDEAEEIGDLDARDKKGLPMRMVA